MAGIEQTHMDIISRLNVLIASHQVAIQEAITIRNELEGFYPPAKKKKKGEVSAADMARVRAGSMRRRKITVTNHK
jgi:hypothetical protein